MKTSLQQGLNEEEKKGIEQEFARSPLLRRQFIALLERKKSTAIDSMVSEKLFEEPNWELRQASYVARVRTLDEIISLFS